MFEALRKRIAELGADALLVTHPANVRYLSGFTSPEDGWALLTDEDAVLVTDGRYIAQAADESKLKVTIAPSSPERLDIVLEQLGKRVLALEADHVTYDTFQTFAAKLERSPVPSKGLIAEFRLRKAPEELATLREAARLTDAAFDHILDFIEAGRQELEVALELEAFMRKQGAEAKSFEIIVASGHRSAMPHGVASGKRIEAGELVTLDFGARVDGYHADMTRTVAVGEIPDEQRRLYDAVLEAQETALAALAPGKDGKDIDALAREILAKYGLDKYFTHGLGHGVGLEIHESPRLRQNVSQTLEPGMTATVEPGVYIPGQAGVRIEDLTVITESGFERLSKSDKALLQL